MNTNIKSVSFSVIAFSSLFYISSCRGTDQVNVLSSRGEVAVGINLLGSDYASSSDSSTSKASLKGPNIPEIRAMQNQTVMVTPAIFLEAELTSSNRDVGKFDHASTKTIALIGKDHIGSGMKFRIIVYKQNNNYQVHKDYTVGEQTEPIMLDSGGAYTIIAYSYGSTSELPKISAGEMMNLSEARINYDDNNRDLMYWKITDFIADGNNPNNKLEITLRHKLTQFTTVINSSIGAINEIGWADIRPHHPVGILSLADGKMSRTYDSDERLKFSGKFPSFSVAADPILINADTAESVTGMFSANLTISGIGNKTIDLPNSFKIKPEQKNNLTINLKKCGAYLASGNREWKEFMCHNLGAVTSANPFIPSADIHGAKYQWGYKPVNLNVSDDRYYTQIDDQANRDIIIGWNQISMPNDSWSDVLKTSNDPCPDGFRVPTEAQWNAVITNNTVSKFGSWNDSESNFGAMARIGAHLYLPTAGYRLASNDGKLNFRGGAMLYWSSSHGSLSDDFASSLNWYYSGIISVGNESKSNGLSIRCIAN